MSRRKRKSKNGLVGLFNQDFSVWTALQYLHKSSNSGVREYLINKLYEFEADDIDFFLPQFCTLVAAWTKKEATQLERFLLDACAGSLHSALKVVWFLHAYSRYSVDLAVKKRCEKLVHDCELAVVNSERPEILHLKRKRESQRLKEADVQRKSSRARAPKLNRVSEKYEKKTDNTSDTSPDDATDDSSLQHAKQTPAGGLPADGAPSSQPPHNNGAIKPAFVEKVGKEEKEKFLRKQRRCEYFTGENDLISLLEQVSEALGALPKSQRNAQLSIWLEHINKTLPRGLYFPHPHSATEGHYGILRIVPNESFCLSSRDKVPFLLHLEVRYTGMRACDPRISECLEVFGADDVPSILSPSRKNTGLPGRVKNAVEAPDQKSGMNGTIKGAPIIDPFGEPFADRKKRIKSTSHYGSLENWDLISVIFKGGDDLRQEHMAMQLILVFDSIWEDAKLPLKLRPYNVLVTSESSGVIETVPDAVSLDHLKKSGPGMASLLKFFEDTWGLRGTSGFEKAQRNFIESTAAYSLVTYFLQIKDRHNGNILLDRQGHIVHIDFGFLLSNSPGGNINFESAPFKLPAEYVEVMGGEDSETFDLFKLLILRGFLEARSRVDKIVLIADIMLRGSKMPCFNGGASAITDLRERFCMEKDEQECIEYVYTLIDESINNWRTNQYDIYQKITNDIL